MANPLTCRDRQSSRQYNIHLLRCRDPWAKAVSLHLRRGHGLYFIIGAILKMHPPPATRPNRAALDPPPASKAMAGMPYIYVTSIPWAGVSDLTYLLRMFDFLLGCLRLWVGPIPWVYVADIFPTRTRHYGLSLASSSQWLWSAYSFPSALCYLTYVPKISSFRGSLLTCRRHWDIKCF
jgi:hypothetical protein